MRRSVENAETVGMRRYLTSGSRPARPARLARLASLARLARRPSDVPASRNAYRGRRARIIYDPPARVFVREPETTQGPVTVSNNTCCYCPVTSAYLYGVTHCPDCQGRRSTHRINFNRVRTRHLHKFHCLD